MTATSATRAPTADRPAADLPTAADDGGPDAAGLTPRVRSEDPTSGLIDPNDAVAAARVATKPVSPRSVDLRGRDPRTAHVQVEDARTRHVTPERVERWVATVQRAYGSISTGSTPDTVIVAEAVTDRPTLGASYRLADGETLWDVVAQLWGDADLGASQLHAALRVLITWNLDVLPQDLSAPAGGVIIQIPADVVPR